MRCWRWRSYCSGLPPPSVHRAEQSDPRYFSETGLHRQRQVLGLLPEARACGRSASPSRARSRSRVHRPPLPARPDAASRDSVQTMNLLDEGLLPYTTINGSTFPAPDQDVKKATPSASDLGKMIEFVRQNAPDTWEGKPANFFKTFSSTVSLSDAFPSGGARPPCSSAVFNWRSGARPRRRRPGTRTTTTSCTSDSSAASCTTTMPASAPRACCWPTT